MELEKYKLGGTHLKQSDIDKGKVLSVGMTPILEYAWDNGVALSRYLAELGNGKIIARKCNKCGRTMIPPRMFCELCWRATDEWVQCKDTGTVNTFSVCKVNWDASRIPEGEPPHLPAVIHIDGASPHVGILHVLGEVDPDDIKIGMKVKAVWKPPSDREGSVTDILYFKPVRQPRKKSKKSKRGRR